MLEILKAIFLFFDAAIYSLVAYAYDLFILIAQLNFNVISVWFEPIVDRLETLILVLILFKLGISFITYMFKPESFQDKSKGGSALLKNIVLVAVLLVSYKFVFDVFNELTMLVMGYQPGTQFTVLNQIAGVEADPGGDEGFLHRFVFGEKQDFNDYGVNFASTILLQFMSGEIDGQDVTSIVSQAKENGGTFSLLSLCSFKNSDLDYHFPILSTAVGLYLLYTIVQMAIQVGVRVFKLIVLRIVAPAVIVTMVDDGTNSKTFNNYWKVYLSELTSVFVRIFTMYLISAFAGMIFNNMSALVPAGTSGLTTIFASIILIVAAFRFAGQLPAFIDSIIGSKLAGSGNTGGFGHFMAGLGGALLGAGSGLAAGVAGKAGVAGALGNMVAGGFNGAGSAARSTNVADFFKNTGATSQANRERAGKIARQGGGLAYAGAGIENFMGIPQRQAQQAQVLADDNTLIDNVLNAQVDEIKDQTGSAGIKFGDSADSYADAVAQQDSSYLSAQQNYDDLMLQRQEAIKKGDDWDNDMVSDATGNMIKKSEALQQAKENAKNKYDAAASDAKEEWNTAAESANGAAVQGAKADLRRSGRGANTRKLDENSTRSDLEDTKKSNESERQKMMNRGATRRANRQGNFGGQ